LDALHLKASEALSLKVEAEEKVRKDERFEIAKKAIKKCIDNETISDLTGLTPEQIEELRRKMN
jgi:hypothetical protein